MPTRLGRREELLALSLLILLATFVRFYRLDGIPVGLDADEAEKGWEARRVVNGEGYPIFFTAGYGAEPMHYYATALSLRAFGIRAFSVRFASVVAGLLLVPVIYVLARELFGSADGSPSLVPIMSAFWVATSYWHIIYSRIGMEPVYLTLFASTTAYFLWRGIRLQKRVAFILAGAFLAASFYTARPVRFFPILLLIFLGYHLFSNARFREAHLTNVLFLASAFALVFAPLGIYALSHPDVFFRREMAVTILNPDLDDRPLLTSILESAAKTFGMYTTVPDPQFERNPAHRPILDPLSSAFFILGLTAAWLKKQQSAYSFVLLWLVVMSLPGALTPDVSPQYTRAIGALPAVALLFSIGIDSSTRWLQRSRPWPTVRRAYWPLLGIVLVTIAFLSNRHYFLPWIERQRQGLIMQAREIEAARVMNGTYVPEGVWILPASPVDAARLPFFAVSFLYEGTLAHHTLHVDETSCSQDLTEVCQGHSRALVVNWTDFVMDRAYESQNSDPKGLIDFLLRKYGMRLEVEPFDSFDLITYELPHSPDFVIARSFDPVAVNFGDELRLVGLAFGGSSLNPTSTSEEVERKVLPSGKEAWVVLQWQAIGVPNRNYKVAVYLLDARGRLVGQVDKLLLSNYLQPTSGWSAGQLETDYYTLPNAPATPPGEYDIQVVVYDPETMERLAPFDEREGARKPSLIVGTLQVIKALELPQVEPMQQLSDAESNIAPGIKLLGYDLPVRTVGPGERMRLALYWQAMEDVGRDYLISLQLKDAEGKVMIERRARPVDSTYPTPEWTKDEVLRDWHDLALPADTTQGVYGLFVRVLEEQEALGEVALGEVEVRGRERRFVVPEMQHSMEAKLGERVQFLGYDLSSHEVKAGDTFHLTVYWQALGEMEVSYTVFTHLLDMQNQIWGQRDSIPGVGTLPTTSWVEGEIITDEYEIFVDPAAPPGQYVIEIGMYDVNTGERLLAYQLAEESVGDRILLGEIELAADD